MTRVINLKEIDKQTAKLLLQFFDAQVKLGFHVWKKEVNYKFVDGNEFSFSHDMFQRQRKEGREGVRYEAISKKDALGKGSYGSVHKIKGTLALHEHTVRFKKTRKNGQTRVVKIQQHELQDSTDSTAVLENEYELSKRTSHLGIKKPTKVSHENTNIITSYMAMNYLPGKSLSQIIEEDYQGINKLTTEQRILISQALLKAVKEQVTDKKIIHRDLKPDNIKIDLKTPITVNILDYGLALDAEKQNELFTGTLLFMPPEMFTMRHLVDAKADVFSLARVLALIWRVDRSEVYNANKEIKSMDDLAKLYQWTPEKRLDGLFTGINDLESEKAKGIFSSLAGMLKTDPHTRFSIDEAITAFDTAIQPGKTEDFDESNDIFGESTLSCDAETPYFINLTSSNKTISPKSSCRFQYNFFQSIETDLIDGLNENALSLNNYVF